MVKFRFADAFFLILCTCIALFPAMLFYEIFFTYPEVPYLEKTWWGTGNNGVDDTKIRPFKVRVSHDALIDLKERLQTSRIITPSVEGAQHEYGINSNFVKQIVQFWATEYKWRERETFLNQYPQFKTQIQGLQIHFVHVKPNNNLHVRVVPLLMLHGWPGSVREFYEIIPMLITPQRNRDFVFEVIVPSLPGFGFSDAARKPGCGPAQMGVIFNNLMKRLGHHTYYIQGGDWGSGIASNMAIFYPKRVLGIHLNFCVAQTNRALFKVIMGSIVPFLVVSSEHQAKMYPLSDRISSFIRESGYDHIQSTKPDTVGVALNDSPSGLAAYILEKFMTGNDPECQNKSDGGLSLKYNYTDLLDNIMIYWITGTITSSMRIYAESVASSTVSLGLRRIPIQVPSACAKFPQEVVYQPDGILKERFHKLVQSTEFPRGGHFAALEEPKLLAGDIWSAVEKMRETF